MTDFEWDERKAESNLAKHGVRFEQAVDAFDDPDALEVVNARAAYGEERVILIGQTAAAILVVVSTEAGREDQDHLGTKGEW